MPKKPEKEDALTAQALGKCGQTYIPVPQRTGRALELLRPRRETAIEGDPPREVHKLVPGHSYSETRRALMAEFNVSDTTAERDIAAAYAVMRSDIAKADYPTTIRAEVEELAKVASLRGDFASSGANWARLAKWAGMEGDGEAGTLSKITDAALDAAIRQNVRSELLGMSDEEFAALVAERAARSAK